MTIESDFIELEKDPEKFVASIQRPFGVKEIVKIVSQKLRGKDVWKSREINTPIIPEITLPETEY
jgi:hypothetical protein